MTSRAKAYAEGEAAGRGGLSTNLNPHKPETEQAIYWRNGWRGGHAEWIRRGRDNHRLIRPAREEQP